MCIPGSTAANAAAHGAILHRGGAPDEVLFFAALTALILSTSSEISTNRVLEKRAFRKQSTSANDILRGASDKRVGSVDERPDFGMVVDQLDRDLRKALAQAVAILIANGLGQGQKK